MNRYKRKGWYNESHRHYLAAKGIKTKYMAHKDNLSFTEFLDEAKNPELQEEESPGVDYFAIGRQKQVAERDRFYAEKDPEEHGVFHHEKMEGQGRTMRENDIMLVQGKCMKRMDDAMSKGEMSSKDREFFMQTDFRFEAEDYLNGHQTKETFEDNIFRKLDHFMRIHSKKLSVFGWSKGDAQ